MRQFHIGLVNEYFRERSGYRVVLDTGASALISLETPVEERFLTGEFSEELFERNYGVGLEMDGKGGAVWYPARICAVIMGVAYRKGGRMFGMEHWTPEWTPDVACCAPGAAVLQEGTITVGLVGGTVAPYYLRGDNPGYSRAGAVLKEAVAGMRITDGHRVLRGRNTGREIVEALKGKPGVAAYFARVDFAYTRASEIIHVQKTTCVDQEYAAPE